MNNDKFNKPSRSDGVVFNMDMQEASANYLVTEIINKLLTKDFIDNDEVRREAERMFEIIKSAWKGPIEQQVTRAFENRVILAEVMNTDFAETYFWIRDAFMTHCGHVFSR